MCTVSIIDFKNNPAKYLKIAQTEQVMIMDGCRVFQLVLAMDKNDYISGEELKNKVFAHIDTLYSQREQIITEDDLSNSYSIDEFKAVMKKKIIKFSIANKWKFVFNKKTGLSQKSFLL